MTLREKQIRILVAFQYISFPFKNMHSNSKIPTPFLMPYTKAIFCKIKLFLSKLSTLIRFVLTTSCHDTTLYDNLHTYLSRFHIFEAIVKSFIVRTAGNDWMQVKENCPLVISFLSISAD